MNDASDHTVLQIAASSVGLKTANAERMPQHASVLYLLPDEQVVARLTAGVDAAAAAARSVQVARWFAGHQVPVATPADVDQPQFVANRIITFWTHYPQEQRSAPAVAELGQLLRLLHEAPPPPDDLPAFVPLGQLPDILDTSTTIQQDDASWLREERLRLLEDYDHLDSALGNGHIHGDAYPGNMLWRRQDAILGDWDEVAFGPREVDLANTYQGTRFGRSHGELDRFAAAYGKDIAAWPGLDTLRAIRELHTLSSYIRRADNGDAQAHLELTHRLQTLRSRDRTTRWTPR